jgi:group I intron endonuclease
MYFLYCIKNLINSAIYVGMTKNMSRRWNLHKHASKKGLKSSLYAAINKYGIENFVMEKVNVFFDKQDCCDAEISAIKFLKENGIKNYNQHPGGSGGFIIRADKKEEWICKLKIKRIGRKPALGMQHTEENKKLFSGCGKKRWELYGTYPKEVIEYPFKIAKEKFGISKTHYYRLVRQATA